MNPTLIQRYWKAIAGLIGPAVILFIIALPDGITLDEWLKIAAAALGTGATVAIAPSNKPKVK